jgi:hypothetical protein
MAVLTIEFGALPATTIVIAIGGNAAPGASTAFVTQLKVDRVQDHGDAPAIAVAVRPAGRVSVTVTGAPVVGVPPTLDAMIV